MMRAPILATAVALVAGASLASPALEAPVRAPSFEPSALSADSSSEGFEVPIGEVAPAEKIVIARKGRGGGGRRGGARRKSHGGFHAGNRRHANRHAGRPGHPGGHHHHHHHGHGHHDLDVDRNIDVDVNDNDDKWGAALVGGVVGMGIGAAINDQPDTVYYNQPPPQYYNQAPPQY